MTDDQNSTHLNHLLLVFCQFMTLGEFVILGHGEAAIINGAIFNLEGLRPYLAGDFAG